MTVHYAPVPIVYHRTHCGPRPADDWPVTYLALLTDHGKGWLAAKQAGVAYKTVQRLRDVDPLFAEHERDARREFIESLEENLDRIGQGSDMPAVTATIVRLKKEDPTGYVEKNLSVTAVFTTELPPGDGKTLLQAMFGPHPSLTYGESTAWTPMSDQPRRLADGVPDPQGPAESVVPASPAVPQTSEPGETS